jgi:hypothetical protein
LLIHLLYQHHYQDRKHSQIALLQVDQLPRCQIAV